MVAWETVQKPKEKGGLGVLNLRLENDALLLKHLHNFITRKIFLGFNLIGSKYYNEMEPHATREVGCFWGKDILRLNNL